MPPLRSIAWHSLIDHSLEICWISHEGASWIFEGAATLVDNSVPFAIDYLLEFDRVSGQTRFEGLVRRGVDGKRMIAVTGSPGTGWRMDGGDTLEAGTCIDLGWTPLTNTLAIWRMDLTIGKSADILNAWVPFPEFLLRPAVQRYTRLAERLYRYEQPEIGFAANLDLDQHGFVVRYGDIWEQVQASGGA